MIGSALQIFEQICDETTELTAIEQWFKNDQDHILAVTEYFDDVEDKLRESELIATTHIQQIAEDIMCLQPVARDNKGDDG